MGDKNDEKFYWFKADKNKVKLQLKAIGKKFIPKKNNWKNFSILITSLVLIAIVFAVYTYNIDDEKNSEIAKKEVEVNYSEQNSEEEASEAALVYQKDDKYELKSEGIELGAENESKNINNNENRSIPKNNLNKRNENTEIVEEEVTFPVGPAPVTEDKSYNLDLIKPLSGEISRRPGWFYHPVFEDWRYEPGLVFNGNNGQNVMAAASGEVISVEQDIYYGIKVVISHDNQWQTLYGHLTDSDLSVGDKVAKRQSIGKIGDQGLYFELRKKGNAINPEEFLNN